MMNLRPGANKGLPRKAHANSKIPDTVTRAVYVLAGEGVQATEISRWLKAKHDISITPAGVHNWLKRNATERFQVLTEVARETCRSLVLPATGALDAQLTRLLGHVERAVADERWRDVAKFEGLLIQAADTALKYGAGSPGHDPPAVAASAAPAAVVLLPVVVVPGPASTAGVTVDATARSAVDVES